MKIKILHLFPDLLNLYGDKGNIASMVMRLKWRGIDVSVREHTADDGDIDLKDIDIVFLGGGSDREQEVVSSLLLKAKDSFSDYVENDGVLIATCGGFAMLGNFYETSSAKIHGIGVLDISTTYTSTRVIGNVVLESELFDQKVVGFENYAGITDIKNHTPFAKVLSGRGETEGVVYKNVIATHLHGPLLPKNPQLCDHILSLALAKKYPDFKELTPLDDTIENKANEYMTNRLLNA